MIECVFVEIRYQQDFLRNLKLLRGHSVTVGREAGDLVFPHDLEMSGSHFRIDVEDTECRITDLGSTNSTWLNDSVIQQTLVQDGNEVRAGNTTFRFKVQRAAAAQRPVDTTEMRDDESREDESGLVTPATSPDLNFSPVASGDDTWQAMLASVETPDSPVPKSSLPDSAVPESPIDEARAYNTPVSEIVGEPLFDRDPEQTFCDEDAYVAAPSKIEITLIEGNASADSLVIAADGGNEVVIGREEPVDLKVDDEKVSAQHCKISLDTDSFVVRDLSSTNGTRLNGQEVTEARVRDGDELQIGDTRFAIGIKYDR